MELKAGTRLGPYEIVAPAGAGGMGEVYRARDTRLDRTVALKILPAEFAQSAQLKIRFRREAKAISQLTHPHICTLYDVGENYLVMEYLEGETLADRLEKGPLPISQVLRYGSEIAEALDVAHRTGIIHRDLKPMNVMLTQTGAKVLDFGLARHVAQSKSDDLLGPTEQKPLTQEGTIIGTIQYMAPEQLEGREADARTDIFALGAVLYEMTTGGRAFEGKSRASLIASIMHDEPLPLTARQPVTPPALDHVVRKCLEKDPENRWQSAHDVAEELKWIGSSGTRAAITTSPSLRKSLLLGALAILLIAAAAVEILRLRQRPVAASRLESAILPPQGVRFSTTRGPMALSPDGTRVACVARDSQGRTQIWIRPLGSSAAVPVRGTDGALSPFWSPDGRYLGFFAETKLKKIPVEGGVPEALADAGADFGATWSSQGTIIFGGTYAQWLRRVSASGGQAEPVTTVGLTRDCQPSFLADGRRFLFTKFRTQQGQEGVYAGSLDSKKTTLILPGTYSNAIYTSGFLVYSRGGDLLVQRFDVDHLKTIGDPVRIADRVAYDASRAAAFFSASQNGLIVYFGGGAGGMSRLVWVDRTGKELGTLGAPGMYYVPRLSPDQRRLAFDWSDAITNKGDIWIFDLQRNVPSKFTFEPVNESAPNWSPDGQRIVYMVEGKSDIRMFEKAAGGAGREHPLPNISNAVPCDWSKDGKFIAVNIAHLDSPDLDIGVLAEGKLQPWLATPFAEYSPAFSPDGRWLAYTSDESGPNEVYVQSFPQPGTKRLVSQGGGSHPAWRGDGRELYYVSADSEMMSVPIQAGERFEIGTPKRLFSASLSRSGGPQRQYDVTPDGQRFLLNRTMEDEGSLPMTLLQNWMPR